MSRSIPQWIVAAFARHRARFGPAAFPDAEAELEVYLGDWAAEFARILAAPEEVERASAELARLGKADRPEWRPDHLPALSARVRANRAAGSAPCPLPAAPADDLEPAWAAWRALGAHAQAARLASATSRYPGLTLGLARLACVLEIAGRDVLAVFPSALAPRRDRRAEFADLRRRARMAPDVARLPGDPPPPAEGGD